MFTDQLSINKCILVQKSLLKNKYFLQIFSIVPKIVGKLRHFQITSCFPSGEVAQIDTFG